MDGKIGNGRGLIYFYHMKIDLGIYLKQHMVVNGTLFWSPLDRYNVDQAKRIEAQLIARKSEYGVKYLYYVHPKYSLSGLDGFFRDRSEVWYYLGA